MDTPALVSSVLIANRGEIACRIIRTCRRLGIRSIAVYSDADARARHVRLADEAWHIGGSRPADSYLRIEAVLDAARRSGAAAIHPGYGFLSENAEFAEAVEAAGIVFIGPRAASMRKLGSKAGAKELMAEHGVPVVPGYTGADQDPALLRREAGRIGYPLMIKAAHGGGGKGMRVVREDAEFEAALASCQREAANAFGRDRVLLERYIEQPRHIEFQIFGDQHGGLLHLNERECSAQRRYQKVLEETPSLALDAALRERMGAAAVAAGRAVDYINAGTVEFILGADGQFYFMEINTRLQVEHPVTECVTGQDLVEWQLRVASGQPLPLSQEEIRPSGHALELRLYAEDADRGFMPGSGTLHRLELPAAEDGVRIDAGVDEGDAVTVFYDPMIAKLIVHAADRPAALAAMQRALAACHVVGTASNIGFLERLIDHPAVREARIDTGYLDRHLDEFLTRPEQPPIAVLAAAAALRLDQERDLAAAQAAGGPDPNSPWALADGWRIGQAGSQPMSLSWRQERYELAISGHAEAFDFSHAGARHVVRPTARTAQTLSFELDGRMHRLPARIGGDDLIIHFEGRRYVIGTPAPFGFEAAAVGAQDSLRAPMPGRIVQVLVELGAEVEAEQPLLVMEAMKMELTLRAPLAGTVAQLEARNGEIVEADALLVKLEARS
ncbi:acetyl/propionyl/methylcrotonyl-CoA carboxylase subunit alpha [Pseudomarimonas salicorniae]|uniref:ATP-grasp domain-containing protein n=1 Tax=Pseudomarimonas salicorniae TaxID=2933270 RepID=A0ABT0GF16_9GAMM|nr:biotin carboxylase N-terminal domain-containing protein [Lysobacter sp. CAU 1642]MCK7593131.1 ATP-grasp domain-containing protein [Lysobacter sp. CAU 1642]